MYTKIANWFKSIIGAVEINTNAPPPSIPFSVFIAKQVCEAMIKSDLSKFLMRDYVLPSSLSSYDLANKSTAQTKLSDILADILRFLELPQLVKLKAELTHHMGRQAVTLKTQTGK